MGMAQWPQCWDALRNAWQAKLATEQWTGKNMRPVTVDIAPPATLADIATVEARLGMPLPASLVRVLTLFSARVSVVWQLPDDANPPEPYDEIFSGECNWDIAALPALYTEDYQSWLDNCFSNPDDPYDAVWHNKFPIMHVPNGDMIAIDLAVPGQPVVYLSHDDGEGHGYRLGNDFEDFIDRFSLLGCPGAEDWQWICFTDGSESGLQAYGAVADGWRAWFGLELPAFA